MAQSYEAKLKTIQWQDLLTLSRSEIIHELLISLPWLIASLVFASMQWYLPALCCSFLFFLTGLRQVHNAYHYALGLSRPATEWVMFLLSLLMLGSMHAVQINHLRHHRYCLSEQDVEAMSAHLPAWRAIAIGPLFPLVLHHKALVVANRKQRRWIIAELLANAVLIIVVFVILDTAWLQYHFAAMLLGQCLTAYFAVWTVHHDCQRDEIFARTIRNRLKALITYNMFYHLEHHLFPQVPTCKLPVLAYRLDQITPELSSKKVY